MDSGERPKVSSYSLFPSRLVTLSFSDVCELNNSLCDLLDTEFAKQFDMHPDSMNLMTLASSKPAINRLGEMFMEGMRAWWAGAKASRPAEVDLVMFSNYAAKGEVTLPHNHNADLVGVYYARTADTNTPALLQPAEDDDYFDAGNGMLVIHDPRFNANMAAVGERDYVKIAPRPGLMVIFPAFIWHTVTPHHGETHRVSFSMNYTFRWSGRKNAVLKTIDW
jgi:hypothetical protein